MCHPMVSVAQRLRVPCKPLSAYVPGTSYHCPLVSTQSRPRPALLCWLCNFSSPLCGKASPTMRHHTIGSSGSRGLSLLLSFLLTISTLVSANVEKAIFLGPTTVNVPLQGPSLQALNLHTLSSETNSSVRLELARKFPSTPDTPTAEAVTGEQSWFLLDDLVEGQRYEVRICWSALVRIGMAAFQHLIHVPNHDCLCED